MAVIKVKWGHKIWALIQYDQYALWEEETPDLSLSPHHVEGPQENTAGDHPHARNKALTRKPIGQHPDLGLPRKGLKMQQRKGKKYFMLMGHNN